MSSQSFDDEIGNGVCQAGEEIRSGATERREPTTGIGVDPCTERRRHRRLQARGGECRDGTGEHVTRARHGESLISVADRERASLGSRHDGERPLQQHGGAGRRGEITTGGEPIRAGRMAGQRRTDRRTILR